MSYLPEFFTPERLAAYRELNHSFRMWCGFWPREFSAVPQISLWQAETRIEPELRRLGLGPHDIATLHNPWERVTKTSVPSPIIDVYNTEVSGSMMMVVSTPLDGASLTAIAYTFRDWGGPGTPRT